MFKLDKFYNKRAGIYLITNTVNGKIYVGRSNNLRKRIYHHIGKLRANKHDNHYLQFSFNKYGENNFKTSVCYIQKEYDCKLLNLMEGLFIKTLHTLDNKFGYNIADETGLGGETLRLYERGPSYLRKPLIALNPKTGELEYCESMTATGLHPSRITGAIKRATPCLGRLWGYVDSTNMVEQWMKYIDKEFHKPKPRRCLDIETGKEYKSIRDCAKETGVHPSWVAKNNKRFKKLDAPRYKIVKIKDTSTGIVYPTKKEAAKIANLSYKNFNKHIMKYGRYKTFEPI